MLAVCPYLIMLSMGNVLRFGQSKGGFVSGSIGPRLVPVAAGGVDAAPAVDARPRPGVQSPLVRERMRERCVSGQCGTTRSAADRHSRRTRSDQVVPDTETASGTTQQALARTSNPLVVGSSPTGPTGGRRGMNPLTCYAASASASADSGAVCFRALCRDVGPDARTGAGPAVFARHRPEPDERQRLGCRRRPSGVRGRRLGARAAFLTVADIPCGPAGSAPHIGF